MILSAFAPFFKNPVLRNFSREALLKMEPETAHRASIRALQLGLVPGAMNAQRPELKTELAGLSLKNPVGMAAGFDKNAEAHVGLGDIGFGMSEVGTVTPRPQKGNPQPRLFRLKDARGVINRMGFNNDGHAEVYERLSKHKSRAIVGVNIGANKDSTDFVADYVAGVTRFSDIADYFTINISSPNTPGLRDLQTGEQLKRLLGEVLATRAQQSIHVPVFLKIAPDLDEVQMDEIAGVIAPTDLEGLIVSNTTISRETVKGQTHADEAGGLSGRPLFELSTRRLAQMRQRVGSARAIIGVGGIHSAKSAFAKIEAGADAIQLYSALVFEGMELLDEINTGLINAVVSAGKNNIAQCMGSKTDQWARGKAD